MSESSKRLKRHISLLYGQRESLFHQYLKGVRSNVEKLDDDKLNTSFQNPREVERDSAVTKLLASYVDTYEKRQTDNRGFRQKMFWLCFFAVSALTLAIVFSIVYLLVWTERSITDIVALVTACVAAIGSLAFLLEIIAKYVFPSNEEEHISQMVQAVQKNDLEERKLRYEYQMMLMSKNEDAAEKNQKESEQNSAGA